MNKNEIYDLIIEDIGNNGEGIAKIDNYVIFIPFAIIDELVKVKILKVNKNFAFGKLIEVLKPSPFRIDPPCQYFYKCGGCNLQHINYNYQLKLKTKMVKTTLEKQLGKIKVDDCFASDKIYGYRNKMQLPTLNNKIGMYRENSHDIIEITNCLLCENWVATIIEVIKDFSNKYNLTFYDEQTHKGLLRNILVRKIDDSYSITLVINGSTIKNIEKLSSMLLSKFGDNFSLFICKNTKPTNTILTDDITNIYGNKTQKTTDFGIEYLISPNSFLQINRYIQNQIYTAILENIDTTDTIIDAYSGAGLLTAILSKKATEVYGIEIVGSATENANSLIKHNNIQNVKNINGDCGNILPNLISNLREQNKKISLVLDPPRKGCDSSVLNAINISLPDQILYLSCNPSTLARDLKILSENYNIIFVKPYDMFPQTKHIETLVKLEKKNK